MNHLLGYYYCYLCSAPIFACYIFYTFVANEWWAKAIIYVTSLLIFFFGGAKTYPCIWIIFILLNGTAKTSTHNLLSFIISKIIFAASFYLVGFLIWPIKKSVFSIHNSVFYSNFNRNCNIKIWDFIYLTQNWIYVLLNFFVYLETITSLCSVFQMRILMKIN